MWGFCLPDLDTVGPNISICNRFVPWVYQPWYVMFDLDSVNFFLRACMMLEGRGMEKLHVAHSSQPLKWSMVGHRMAFSVSLKSPIPLHLFCQIAHMILVTLTGVAVRVIELPSSPNKNSWKSLLSYSHRQLFKPVTITSKLVNFFAFSAPTSLHKILTLKIPTVYSRLLQEESASKSPCYAFFLALLTGKFLSYPAVDCTHIQ